MAIGVLLGLVLLPILEIVVLIKTGQAIGLWATLGLLIGAGILGAMLLRRQSFSALQKVSNDVNSGRPPLRPMLDAGFLALIGLLLILPGLLTDVIALVLLIPPVRTALTNWWLKRVRVVATIDPQGPWRGPGRDPRRLDPGVIEGDYERLDDPPAGPRGG